MPAAWLGFDLDGTLIDARRRQVEVTAALLAARGAPELHRTRFWRLKRAGATTGGALVTLGYAPGLAEAIAVEWRVEMESDQWLAGDRTLPGAARALRRLRQAGYQIAVLTARRRPDGAATSVDAAGIARAVDQLHVVSPDEAVAGKAHVLAQMSAASFIGDSDTDGAAARAAAVRFAAVSTGQRSRAYLRAAGYDPVRSLHAALVALGL